MILEVSSRAILLWFQNEIRVRESFRNWPHTAFGNRCGANSGTVGVLSLGRAVVGSVGVSLTDLAVFTMDEHFASLVFGDSASGFDGGALGVQDLRGVDCTGGFDCPPLRVWDDVLVPFHWMLLLSILLFAHKMW